MLFPQRTKKFTRLLGMEICRHNIIQSMDSHLLSVMCHQGIDLVFDIGDNNGKYGQALREGDYTGSILYFEPFQTAHKKLTSVASGNRSWLVTSRTTIGAIDDEIEINISGNSTSSSILNMQDSHLRAAPQS